jgi:tetratricopeptide (TPR) repeat protein
VRRCRCWLRGADHPFTLTSRNNLASALQASGRLGEALPLFERAVADTERSLGPADPRLAVCLYQVGDTQAGFGDLVSAVATLNRAVEVDTAAYGPDHLEVATDLEALAAVQERRGDVEGAVASGARAERRPLGVTAGDVTGVGRSRGIFVEVRGGGRPH